MGKNSGNSFLGIATFVVVVIFIVLNQPASQPDLRKTLPAIVEKSLQPLATRLAQGGQDTRARLERLEGVMQPVQELQAELQATKQLVASLSEKLAAPKQEDPEMRRQLQETVNAEAKAAERLAHIQEAVEEVRLRGGDAPDEPVDLRDNAAGDISLPPAGFFKRKLKAPLLEPAIQDAFGCPVRVPWVNETQVPLSPEFLKARREFMKDRGIKCVVLEDNLPIVAMPQFISADVADHIREKAAKHIQASMVNDPATGKARPDEGRTSYNGWLLPDDGDPIVWDLYRQASFTTGVRLSHFEGIQLIKYALGQEYRLHTDGWFRQVTLYIYLADVEEGGETRWPFYEEP
eukprot:TRINITY_DN15993_c0_g1_i1.p1 TRINITY_DN15993_c0_g1~~TRINITY_DN15993_c0_g1_i1.p1  ORF type:complete len:348 (-),score=61.38 TRINITY_DN15993_c0_g1_i1:267-1310(-)